MKTRKIIICLFLFCGLIFSVIFSPVKPQSIQVSAEVQSFENVEPTVTTEMTTIESLNDQLQYYTAMLESSEGEDSDKIRNLINKEVR